MTTLFFCWFASLVFCILIGSFLLAWRLKKENRKRITELTDYLEKVNTGGAWTILQKKEDDFSLLADEIYKTVTSLYQTREEAVKAKENFADNLANIAHQLKTPITASFLSLELMEKTAPNLYGEQMKRQMHRLHHLEESLLTLSKIDSGALHLEKNPVDLYTVLNLAAENLEDLLKEKEITVEIPCGGCVEIMGDMEWTMEAFMNLMKNCMEHSRPGSVIHCDYSGNALYAEVKIWDEGSGFCEEDLPHLFERFYCGKNGDGKGAGLGLAISRSIFELENGSIFAENLPDKGACFEVRIYHS